RRGQDDRRRRGDANRHGQGGVDPAPVPPDERGGPVGDEEQADDGEGDDRPGHGGILSRNSAKVRPRPHCCTPPAAPLKTPPPAGWPSETSKSVLGYSDTDPNPPRQERPGWISFSTRRGTSSRPSSST